MAAATGLAVRPVVVTNRGMAGAVVNVDRMRYVVLPDFRLIGGVVTVERGYTHQCLRAV